MFRFVKDTGKVDKIGKAIFWEHLKYYFTLTPELKKEVNEYLYKYGKYETPLYVFSINPINPLKKRK